MPNTTTDIATDSDSAVAGRQAISAEMATTASDYERAGVRETLATYGVTVANLQSRLDSPLKRVED